MSYFVYKISNDVNNLIYVGLTADMTVRWKRHLTEGRYSDHPLYNDMALYGSGHFKIEIIETCSTRYEGLKRELFWILQLKTLSPYGYNLIGGKTQRPSEFPKKLIHSIRKALDGRTQKWLANKIGMRETELSNKMQGITKFSEDDMKKISEVFECEFV